VEHWHKQIVSEYEHRSSYYSSWTFFRVGCHDTPIQIAEINKKLYAFRPALVNELIIFLLNFRTNLKQFS